MKTNNRHLLAAVLAVLTLFVSFSASAQAIARGSNSLAFPFTIVASGGSSNVLGIATAVGNLGVWTPTTAVDVQRSLSGMNVTITWEYSAVTNGVAQTAFFLQPSADGVHWENDFSRLIAIIHPAKTTSTNLLTTSTNLSQATLAQWKKFRLGATTNGGQPTISNFVGYVTWEK